ncbi:hypothetical protein EYF80_010505 [Liparis tanakae]|uniref:Uncharacterized protein n=1 Tax=Liparis tanakae TaxID=230148 RepID=A0A4Z2IMI9_9TELE|nr:hypothetical protein EYF80_010505 [Liparis tanakae]
MTTAYHTLIVAPHNATVRIPQEHGEGPPQRSDPGLKPADKARPDQTALKLNPDRVVTLSEQRERAESGSEAQVYRGNGRINT